MTTKDLLHEWLRSVGADERLLDDSGRCCLFVHNNEFKVFVEAPSGCDDIFIIIEIVEMGVGEMRRKRMDTAMKLNVYGLETRGGVLGWDAISEGIVLSFRVTAENITKQQFANIVSNLLEVAKQIRPQLAMEKEQEIQDKVASELDHMFS